MYVYTHTYVCVRMWVRVSRVCARGLCVGMCQCVSIHTHRDRETQLTASCKPQFKVTKIIFNPLPHIDTYVCVCVRVCVCVSVCFCVRVPMRV